MKNITTKIALVATMASPLANATSYTFTQDREIVYFPSGTVVDSQYDNNFSSSGRLVVDTTYRRVDWRTDWVLSGETVPVDMSNSYTDVNGGRISLGNLPIVIIPML